MVRLVPEVGEDRERVHVQMLRVEWVDRVWVCNIRALLSGFYRFGSTNSATTIRTITAIINTKPNAPGRFCFS